MKSKTRYIDGFVLTVPKNKFAAYKKMATEGKKFWMEHGALEYRECVADDMKAPWALPFPKLTKAKPGEVVWFSWIEYKSKAHRDAVNKKVMSDPIMNEMPKDMPFDMKKMAYGGFKIVVSS